MTSLQRIVICTLLAILTGNLILCSWLTRRLGEVSSDRIVQKAYVVTRMISEASGRSILARQPTFIRDAVDEALRDPHLIGVVIKGKRDETLFETAVPDPPEKYHTFDTPILINGKRFGTVTTRFRLDSADSRLTRGLNGLMSLQSALLVGLLALGLYLLRRRRLQLTLPQPSLMLSDTVTAPDLPAIAALTVVAPVPAPLPMLPDPALVPQETAADAADTVVPPPELQLPAELVAEAFHAGKALQEALTMVTARSRQHALEALHTERTVADMTAWSSSWQATAERITTLIASGLDIIALVRTEAAANAGETAPDGCTGIPERLHGLANELHATTGHSTDTAPAADNGEAALFRDLAHGLRHEALSPLLAARSATAASAALLSTLDTLVTDLANQADILVADCGRLNEAAVTAGDRGDSVTTPLRDLTRYHGDRLLAFRRRLRRAEAIRTALGRELDRSATLFSSAGSAVENAATAALQGSAIISGLQERMAQQSTASAQTAAGIETLAAELAAIPRRPPEPDHGATLGIAAETLQLAADILQESCRLPGLRSAPGPATADAAAPEDLIRQAQVSLGILLQHLSGRIPPG